MEHNLWYHPRMKLWVDTTPRDFHGYKVHFDSTILSKKGIPLKTSKRERRGGGYDLCVTLRYNGQPTKWTLSRLVASCFFGNIDGMEINHDKRNPENCSGYNLDIMTRSQNQRHWRDYGRDK